MVVTGIVRYVDELGRIAIPKAIRKQMGIDENTPMEFIVNSKGDIILRKYTPENLTEK